MISVRAIHKALAALVAMGFGLHAATPVMAAQSGDLEALDLSLAELGYSVTDDSKSRIAALMRFRALGDHSGGSRDATAEIMRLQTIALTKDLPCPDWAADVDDSAFLVDMAVQFRGHTAAAQAAASHQRIEKCYKHHVFAPTKGGAAGKILMAAGKSRQFRRVELAELPPTYAGLSDFLRAAGDNGPRHGFEIVTGGAFYASIPANVFEGADGALTPAQVGDFCRTLRLPESCADPATIETVRDFPTTDEPNGPVVAYSAEISADVVTLWLRAPASLVTRMGFDLTEVATLATGIDGWGDAIKPRYFDDRPRGLQVDSSQLYGAEYGPTMEMPTPQNENADAIEAGIRRFWGSLMHVPTKKNAYDPVRTGMEIVAGLRSELSSRSIFVVDDIQNNAQSLRELAHSASSNTASNNWESWAAIGNAPWIQGSGDDRLAHALFAANLIGATKTIDNQRKPMMTGLARGAKVTIGSAVSLFEYLSSQQRLSTIVTFVYKSGTEPCVRAGSNDGSQLVVPQLSRDASGGDRVSPTADLNRSRGGSLIGFGQPENYHNKIQQALKGAGVLAIISASQWSGDDAVDNCVYYNNTVDIQKYIKEKANYTGTYNCSQLCDYYFPSFFYPRTAQQPYANCSGLHCDTSPINFILAGALDTSDVNRLKRAATTRMSFDSDATMLFAPGVNIIGPESQTYKEAVTKEGIGARSGTSYAGPIIAAVAALVRAKHDNNVTYNDMKKWLAATATVPVDLRDAFEAGMTYGAVNLQRAVESDPAQFTVWKKDNPTPVIGSNIKIGDNNTNNSDFNDLELFKLQSDADEWKTPLSLIRNREQYFYLIKADGTSSKKSLGLSDNRPSLVTHQCGPKNQNLSNYGCITVIKDNNDQEEIPVLDVSHIIFPSRFWKDAE